MAKAPGVPPMSVAGAAVPRMLVAGAAEADNWDVARARTTSRLRPATNRLLGMLRRSVVAQVPGLPRLYQLWVLPSMSTKREARRRNRRRHLVPAEWVRPV